MNKKQIQLIKKCREDLYFNEFNIFKFVWKTPIKLKRGKKMPNGDGTGRLGKGKNCNTTAKAARVSRGIRRGVRSGLGRGRGRGVGRGR